MSAESPCMCWAYDADTGEYGMRPCPRVLCELSEHKEHYFCCGDPGDCDGCVVSNPEIEQLAAEQSVYFDADGNSAPLDEALS